MKKSIAEWYWESYKIISYEQELITHKQFMSLVILGKFNKEDM